MMNKKDVEEDLPGILINDREKERKLLEYTDTEFSMNEEKKYYKKEKASYFARMDTEIKYKNKQYYKKFYISKDVEVERIEKGAYDSSGVYQTPDCLREMGRERINSCRGKRT